MSLRLIAVSYLWIVFQILSPFMFAEVLYAGTHGVIADYDRTVRGER